MNWKVHSNHTKNCQRIYFDQKNGNVVAMATSSRVPRTRWAKFRRYIRLVATFLFSHIGLCILVMGYALLGAALFQWLESDNARKARRHINLEKQNLVLKLWNITYLPMLLRADVWKQQASGNLREFTASMVQLVQKRGYDGMDEEAEATQWDFMGSLLYSIIIMTTIGYGDIAPKTVGGRMVTIFYAIIGIPLMLVFMNNIGNVLASSFKFLYWKICCQYCFDGRRRRSKKSRKKNRPGSGQRSPVIDGEVIRISREDAKQASKVPIIPNKYVDDDPDNNQRLGSRKTKVKSREIKRLSTRRFKGREKQSQLQQLKSISPTKTASTTTTTTVQIQQPISTIQALAFQYENSDDISSDESEDEDDGNIPILVCLIIVVCYICLGALLFREFEDWPFGDSAYFCFITLTTIGFGDFVPQGIKTRSTDQKQIINRVYSALYLLFGMALMAMSFNVIKESVINTFRALGKKIGLVKGGKGCY